MQNQENSKFVSFLSPYKQFRLVITSAFPKTQFTEGRTGKYVQFENNNFTTADPETIAWLRAHTDYGIKFFENKEGSKKEELSPELMELAKEINEDDLKDILRRVREGKKAMNAPSADMDKEVKTEEAPQEEKVNTEDEAAAIAVTKKKIEGARVKQVQGARTTAVGNDAPASL